MKSILSILLSLFVITNSFGQEISSSFKVIPVNKKIIDFPDTFDLSTPLNSGITFTYILMNGKDGLVDKASSKKYRYSFTNADAPDAKVDEESKKKLQNLLIKECIVYKDSIAGFICEESDWSFTIRTLGKENGNWVNYGEDGRRSLAECRSHFEKYAEQTLQELKKITAFSSIPTDTASFINYLKIHGVEPKEFILNKLKNYKLVMYGEIHRRKASWDFLQSVINDQMFAESTGVIFMEMATNKQKELNQFYANKSIDTGLLLNIFRDYIIAGWNDKGMFDFLIAIWHLNQKLPDNKKIKIIAVDTSRIFTEEGIKTDTNDRNQFMAKEIMEFLNLNKDKRNSLFIVGSGHLYKSSSTAGSILAEKMPINSYTLFTHCPRVDNITIIHERIRHGIFDYAFYKNGDIPVAFDLKNSPYGKEPFDGLYLAGSGTYQDNYDGYIFFGSLDREPSGEILIDMYDDKFIKEIDRRYKLLGWNLIKEWRLKDLSSQSVIEKITSEQTKTRWEDYIEPMLH